MSARMPWKKSEPMDQRIEFCCKALRGGNFRALCREYGISAKTGYKWQERFLRDGARGMVEESRRPRSCERWKTHPVGRCRSVLSASSSAMDCLGRSAATMAAPLPAG